MRNHHCPKLSLTSYRLLLEATPPTFLLFLYKVTFLPFVRLAYGFALACLSQIAMWGLSLSP